MTRSLDFFLLPIWRQNNRDMDTFPGLVATQAPRRVGRGRSGDTLLIHLFLEGTAPLSPKGYSKLLAHLSEIYFKTPGSSTTAMGTVVSWLNEYLLERNRRGAERDMHAVGTLTLVVLRGKRLNLAQCGSTHAFLINDRGITHFQDEESTDLGLGLGQAANVRYHLFDLSPDDKLIITPQPPPIWTKTALIGLRGLPMNAAHKRLIERIGPELQAALIQFKSGSGDLKIIEPQISPAEPLSRRVDSRPRPAMTSAVETILTSAKEPLREEVIPPEDRLPGEETLKEDWDMSREGQSPGALAEATSPVVTESRERTGTTSPPIVPETAKKKPDKVARPKPTREPFLGPALLKIGRAIGVTLKQAGHMVSQMVKRMLPDESLPTISTSTMAFIALAVPVVVVAVAATVYFKRGRGSLYEQHYIEAQYAAEAAAQLTEPPAMREAWNIVLGLLDQAEEYQITEDSQAMRGYAQTVLDNLDFVVRLPFQPALAGALPGDAIIHRIVVAEGDSVIYLLNETDGRVYRGTLTDEGYVIDQDFICQPVPTPLIVGPLVDILPIPLASDEDATLLGMDGNGNLMKCIPGGEPPLAFPMPPPDMHWGNPLAFESTALGLYVLDPVTNAVWVFWANDEFAERPTLFFDEQIPPMGDVIDLTLNRDELYLLHQDGHLTTCTFGYPTRCTDPAMVTDLRQGGSSSATIDGAIFREIILTSPPDSSIFLLEPTTPAIYRFTLRLNYHNQYRPLQDLAEGEATAFTVSSGRQLFLAIGNQVYVAPMP